MSRIKDFILSIKEGKIDIREIGTLLKTLPNDVIREIGKKIIYSDYDGYNNVSMLGKMQYFDNLDRWQKEFFIKQRLYKLYS